MYVYIHTYSHPHEYIKISKSDFLQNWIDEIGQMTSETKIQQIFRCHLQQKSNNHTTICWSYYCRNPKRRWWELRVLMYRAVICKIIRGWTVCGIPSSHMSVVCHCVLAGCWLFEAALVRKFANWLIFGNFRGGEHIWWIQQNQSNNQLYIHTYVDRHVLPQ